MGSGWRVSPFACFASGPPRCPGASFHDPFRSSDRRRRERPSAVGAGQRAATRAVAGARPHSLRSAATGSSFTALRAGRYVASSTTAPSVWSRSREEYRGRSYWSQEEWRVGRCACPGSSRRFRTSTGLRAASASDWPPRPAPRGPPGSRCRSPAGSLRRSRSAPAAECRR
jgi:hypothetical protein